MVRKARAHFFWLLAALLAACGGGSDSSAPAAVEPPPPAADDAALAADAAAAAPSETAAKRAARVHREALVLDAHCDTLMRVVDDGHDLGATNAEGHVDFPRMKAGGVDAQVFAVWVDPRSFEGRLWERALSMIDALHREVAEHADQAGLATTAAEARALAAEGKRAAFLGVEGGYVLEGEIERLAELEKRGVSTLTLTWWGPTSFADGSGGEPRWHGLNDQGRDIVREMNRLGIVVDVSHASAETFDDVLAVTTQPVIASHSCTAALADHHRNLTDEQLCALAKNGGVVGIDFVAGFLDEANHAAADALREKMKPELDAEEKKYAHDPPLARKKRWALYKERARAELPPVPLERVIEHIDHAVQVAGVDHVGLGSDFDGFSVGPAGLDDCTALPRITEALLARGYSEDDVAKILGGNFLRVFEQVLGG